ncbi:MAG: competence/damage-inducible protein A [Thermodesulfobacteriota bacterium]|nr:competence/damage-inducible protein A [Thermodesulfobacteriota bacterium]
MDIGILVIGDELTNGMTVDTNSSVIASELNALGWRVSATMAVGDDQNAIKGGLEYLLGISGALVVTGGLGPTVDDITTRAVAGAFGLNLYTDEVVLERLKKRFDRIGFPWTENNAKQAMFPEGAGILDNPVGTACGFFLERDGRPVAVIPGVPGEAKRMLSDGVIPLFSDRIGRSEHVTKKTIKVFRLTEAQIDQALLYEDLEIPGVSIGFYPRFPEIRLVVTSRREDRDLAEENLRVACERIKRQLSRHIFGYGDDTMERVVADLLTRRRLTLSVAESCTGGLITDRLTDVPGSSEFLERGVVTYSNTSKVDLIGVPASTIESHGAVSEDVAILMADGVRKLAGTDIGLATTGIAGPTGGTDEKPVGTVFIALSVGRDTTCRMFLFRWDRRRIKEMASQTALNMLRSFLEGP